MAQNEKPTVQRTCQTNIHSHDFDDMTNYAFMLGGLDVTHDVLQAYDPFKTGFARIFMVRTPLFVNELIPDKVKKFKHILEYANTAINGINNIQMGDAQMQGGYANREVSIPTVLTDGTNEFTIRVYEFSGSPVREVIHFWLTGISDLNSALTTYHGADVPVNQANHSAEFIYVVTDQTGKNIEYACLFANCVPNEIDMQHLNYDGQHDTVPMDIAFRCVKYESPQINEKAKQLLNKYRVLMDSLDFHSKITDETISNMGKGHEYDLETGKLKTNEVTVGIEDSNGALI